MGLFTASRTIGVDVGTSKLKVVELKKARGGKAELSTYGMANLPSDLVRSGSDEIIGEITQALQTIIKRADIKAKRVFASLPGFSVFSQEIVLPKMSRSKLAAAVESEAARHVEGDLSDMVLDWEVLEDLLPPRGGRQAETIKVLLTAAPRQLVHRYANIFKEAGLELESLETESMALTRALIGRDPQPAIIVDLGATATDIIIVEGAMPRFTKTIDVGGLAMTEAIVKGMQVDQEQAEQFKKDFGISHEKTQGQLPEGMRPTIEAVLRELLGVIEAFEKQGGKKPERITLAGGAAKLPDFDRYIGKKTGIETAIGNPFARIIHPPELDTILQDVGPDLGVAIGLSMKDIY